MPADYDKDAYPEPPRKTPVVDKQTALPNPALILTKVFYYAVDLPVTTFRGKLTMLTRITENTADQYAWC